MFKSLFKRYKKIKYNKKEVKVGKNTRILTSYLNFGSEPYLIEIGDNCTITSGVRFLTHDGSIDVYFNLSERERWKEERKYEKLGEIKIENNCFIGVNSIILPKVTIGKNSIVAAGSVVVKNVPAGSIVGGNPAKVIGSIDDYCKKIESEITLINHRDKKQSILKYFNQDK